ncbi:protein PAL OF QUIRKY-like [Wolffia australiana]
MAASDRSRHAPPPQRRHPDGGAATPKIRLMCSFGGKILPRPYDRRLRYAGGETRIVAVPRAATFAVLLAKLSSLVGGGAAAAAVKIKYQLPHEDLDALISVSCDDDVEIMLEENDRLGGGGAAGRRLRLFLFPADDGGAANRAAFIRDRWLLDAISCGGQDDVSSVESDKAAPPPPVTLHMSYGARFAQAGPAYLGRVSSGPVGLQPVYRGSIHPTARMDAFHRISLDGIHRMARVDP